MPAKPTTEGKDPNELVYTHIKIPLWLKRRVVAEAQNQGLDLTAYVRTLLVAAVGTKK